MYNTIRFAKSGILLTCDLGVFMGAFLICPAFSSGPTWSWSSCIEEAICVLGEPVQLPNAHASVSTARPPHVLHFINSIAMFYALYLVGTVCDMSFEISVC